MPFVDAALVTLSWFERAYPDDMKRQREYKRLAAAVGITVEESPELAAARLAAEQAKVMAEFGGDL